MTTIKRISTIETGMSDIIVKLIVTETGYSIKIVKIFGRSIIHPIIALARNVEGSNIVDELFDRYHSAIELRHNMKPRRDGSESVTDVIVNEVSKKRTVIISRRYDNEFVVTNMDNMIYITNIDDKIIISYYYDTYKDDRFLKSRVIYTYDQDNEPISISKEVY